MATVAPEIHEAGPPVEPESGVKGMSPRQLFWTRLKQDRAALGGLLVICLLVVLAIAAPLIAKLVGHGPNDLFQRETTDSFGVPTQGPSAGFLFGADGAGRDAFVRVIYGTRTSLVVGLAATALAVFTGTVLGILAGYFGGKIDAVISRAIDVVLSIPILLFAIGIVAACGTEGCFSMTLPLLGSFTLIEPGLVLVIFVISLFTWPYIARIVRGNTLSIREKEFIEASRSLGAGNGRIMFREVLPNLVAPIVVYSTLLVPTNILFEAALSFLGLGVPQRTPSWGGMLSDAVQYLRSAWWLMVFPGIFLILTTLSFNLLGDGLRDALDPRSNR